MLSPIQSLNERNFFFQEECLLAIQTSGQVSGKNRYLLQSNVMPVFFGNSLPL